jgi:hypothetical protein
MEIDKNLWRDVPDSTSNNEKSIWKITGSGIETEMKLSN